MAIIIICPGGRHKAAREIAGQLPPLAPGVRMPALPLNFTTGTGQHWDIGHDTTH
jgi:hypothetical protein